MRTVKHEDRAMHEEQWERHELEPYRRSIEGVSKPCLVGLPSDTETESYFGGMPLVDKGFTWPLMDGHPLHFIGQLKCSHLNVSPVDTGYLLFFYDNRHWGYSPGDRGHALVLHQRGEYQTEEPDLPECEVKSFFGLRKWLVKPKVYRQVHVQFQEGISYPSLERDLIAFDGDHSEEGYSEFCSEIQPLIQIGGYPSPIQSDFMEDDCIEAFDHGRREDWQLLLQLFEIGDMVWGDAGALYWFIHKEDLQRCCFDRVWMVTQCH